MRVPLRPSACLLQAGNRGEGSAVCYNPPKLRLAAYNMLYILLATLTTDGQQKLIDNPDLINDVAKQVNVPGASLLSRYMVLGRYDFVLIAEAEDPESAARLSLEFGLRAGVHTETLQAINVDLLAGASEDDLISTITEAFAPTDGAPPTLDT